MNLSLLREGSGASTLRTLSINNLIKRIRENAPTRALSAFREEVLRLSPDDSPYHCRQLPRMVVAGVLCRKEDRMVVESYNGIAGVSIDAPAGSRQIADIRRRLCALPQALAVFTGSSGRSVKIWIGFCRTDGTLPDDDRAIRLFHAHACRWAADFIRGQLPEYQIRPQPLQPEYGYLLTSDPEVYYRQEAVPIRMDQPFEMPPDLPGASPATPQRSPLEKMMPGYAQDEVITALFEAALTRAMEEAEEYYTPVQWKEGDLSPLLTTLARYCFRSGIPEENTVDRVLRHFYHRMKEGIVRQVVGNVYRTEKFFGQHPTFPRKMALSLQMDEFMNRRYMFRLNAMTNEVEYLLRSGYQREFRPVTERVVNSIAMNALSEGLDLWDRDVKRWVNSDRVMIYKPIEEFLYTLPAWDKTDRIRPLAARVPCAQAHWQEFFHRWFLSMVAHWMGIDKQHGNALSPLMVGPQGCGKSTFCRLLLPPALLSYYTDSIDFGRRRDAELFLNRFALINIDEFDQISSAQQGFMKHLLQKPEVNVRKPHESVIRGLRRYASFIATSNHTDLLSDPSGSRRFICIEVNGQIDTHAPVNHTQLYAQAVYELRKKAVYWLSPEEETSLIDNNRAFEQAPVAEQLFLQYFTAAEEGEDCEQLLAVEIFTQIQKLSKIRLSPRHLSHFGRLLKKLEIPHKRTNRGSTYFVWRRKENVITNYQSTE